MKLVNKPGKKFWIASSAVLIAALTGTTVGYNVMNASASEVQSSTEEALLQQEDSTNTFEEEGTTQISTDSQLPEFTVNTVTMTVEEVYVASGDTVSAGDALFKITDDSMAAAKEYYADAVADAQSTLTTATLNYQSGQLEAQTEKSNTELDAASAADILNAELLELDQSVQDKYDEWQQAVEDIATYTSNLESNTYYTDAGIDEKTTAVSSAQTAADAAQKEYSTANDAYKVEKEGLVTNMSALKEAIATLAALGSQETGSSETEIASSKDKIVEYATNVAAYYETSEAAQKTLDEKERTLSQANQTLQQAKQSLEQATTSYEKNYSDAETKLEQLEDGVAELQSSYEQAVRDAETKKVDLQNEYDQAILEGTYADATYTASLVDLQNAVDDAQDTLDSLKEEQAALLALENGTVCATQDGTIASVTYEAEDVLIPNTAFVSYYNTETIMISVEVSQENIAKIAVGDSVDVTISGTRRNGAIEGTISTIASSATTGGSVSNVTYAVVISIDNTDGSLSSGSSATVSFQDETVNQEE